jgi:hypothetical protein
LADSCGVVSVSGNSEFVGNFVKELYIDMMGVGGALSLYVSQVVVEGPVEHPIPSTPNPKPHTLNPKPQTSHPQPQTPNLTPSNPNPKPWNPTTQNPTPKPQNLQH